VEVTILGEAIVVAAVAHNPSILHPWFLKTQHIVPDDWEPIQAPICTPPLSVIQYPEGLVFTAEGTKFQVAKSPPSPNLRESKLPEFAAKYIGELPHVKYRAVGINFKAVMIHPKPSKFLIERFLIAGVWNSELLPLSELHLEFIYPLPGGHLQLSCKPGRKIINVPKDKDGVGVIIEATYHQNVVGPDLSKETQEAIMKYSGRYDHFRETLEKVFGEGE